MANISGPYGISGYSGHSGQSGYSGYSGRSGFSGYSGPSGYSGYSGPSGFSGYSGLSGFSGYSGLFGGDTQRYFVDDSIGEVGNVDGFLAHNNSALNSSTTTLSIHQNNLDGTLVGAWVANMTLSTNAIGGRIKITNLANPANWILFNVTGTGVAGILIDGYNYNVPVTYVAGTGIADYTTIAVSFTFAGNSGVSGFSGYSGKSGFSGYSGAGTSGFSGYSGKSGFSGYSGPSGFSGYSGISGYSGYSGSGMSGYSGYSGSGVSGYSGYSGSGVSGYSGYSGLSGYSGYSGISGYSGLIPNGYTTISNSADQDVMAVNSASTDLTFSVFSGVIYHVYGYLIFSDNNALTDSEFSLQQSGGTMQGLGIATSPGTANTPQNVQLLASGAIKTGSVTVGGLGTLGYPTAVTFNFSFAPSTNTVFGVYFGNLTGTTDTTRLHRGSWISYRGL